MKLVATMEEGKKVLIERYEEDVCIGRRSAWLEEYALSVIGEVNIGNIFSHLTERKNEVNYYLNNLYENDTFIDFATLFIQYANKFPIENNDFLDFVKQAFKKVDVTKIAPAELERILMALLENVKINSNEHIYSNLIEILLSKALSNAELTRDIANRFLPLLFKVIQQDEVELGNKMFQLFAPHFDAQDLLAALKQQGQSKPVLMASSAIPKNCVYFHSTSAYEEYVIEIPKRRFRVKFHNVAYDAVGHPRMVAIVKVKGSHVMNLKLFAVKDLGEIQHDTSLYSYPYSNVYNNGDVCWSDLENYQIQQVQDINMLPLTFLSGTNNTHLNENVRELFKEYENQDFNDKYLLSIQNGKKNAVLKDYL